ELDEIPLRFEPDVAPGHLAIIPLAGDGAVDPEGDVLPLAGDLVDVPLAGLLAALRALRRDLLALLLPVHQGVAEDEADVLVADLGLVPDPAVGRGADEDAAVVAGLPFQLPEAPLDVQDAVGELLVVAQHLVQAGAVARQGAVGLQLPGVPLAERLVG